MKNVVLAWVDPDGRLLRAQVRTRDARIGALQFDATVAVDFREDAKLGMLVPAAMQEAFFAGRARVGSGEAKYSNYRRFQTSARIVPPPP